MFELLVGTIVLRAICTVDMDRGGSMDRTPD